MNILLALTLIVSFCSIVYELMLAQCLSIVLGNTVLRYSITIGLYLFSLGMGALVFAFSKSKKNPQVLFYIEMILALFGLLLPFLMLGGEQFLRAQLHSTLASWIFTHSVIIFIGLLSGAEVPILMELGREREEESGAQKILASDYIGTFLGAIAFPLFIYEYLGLVAGAALIGALNAVVALFILLIYKDIRRHFYFYTCAGLIFISVSLIFYEASLRKLLVEYVFG